jgi:hypothetical protein
LEGKNKISNKPQKHGRNSMKAQGKYWAITLQLLTRSKIFKVALVNKLLGQKEFNFHATMTARDLQMLLLEYEYNFKVLFNQRL